MKFCQARVRLVQAGAALAAAVLVAGCGNNFRPVVTPVNPTGPAPQPSSYAVVVSAPSPTTSGIATIIDYSGDSVMARAAVGIGPTTFAVDSSGSTGFTINSDHTLTNFQVSSSLQEKNINYTTVPSTANLVNIFSLSGGLLIADLDGNNIDLFTGSPETYQRAIPMAPTPVMAMGSSSSQQRAYGISQGNSLGGDVSGDVACNLSPATVGVNGEADAIEVSTYTISGRIALGQCPVYAVESSDARRLFVLNRGSDTVTVIDTQTNKLDSCSGLVNQAGQPVTCHPTLPLSTTALQATGITPPNCKLATDPACGGMTATAGPVYAEYNAATNQLVVANYDGGTISVIDASLDEYGNDSTTFGTTFTIPVGNNPASVTVLNDGSRAYTANQSDGTVTVVNLSSHTVVKTLPVTGYPRTVVSTQNSTQGKVYVASPNSPYLTIIRTDQDIVDTTVLVEGNVVDVRVSTQNAVSGNNNSVSRIPGHGQPCNLPDLPGGYQVSGAPAGTTVQPSSSLFDCQTQDATKLK